MRTKTLLLTCVLVAGLPVTALAQSRPVLLTLPAPSEWKSQDGILQVTSVSSGVIQGTFTSSDAACGQTPAAIAGKTTPPKIAFAAMFPDCKTIMSWRGTFTDRAIATGITKTTIQPDGTVPSHLIGGNLFGRTK
jgi:hypothetical protein